MSTNQNQSPIDFRTEQQINACIHDTMTSLEHENTLVAPSPNQLFQRMLKVFIGLKPLLVFLTTFAFIPQTWRMGLTVLVQVIEALAAIGPEVTVQFKAGRDLEEAV